VRLRIEGERVALPGPALTPYLVGLLVMLGMLGTFLGMVLTFKGAVFALEGSTDLQAIRSALAAPIKGLGLAFGTSVAGVATSAMLGLLSAISRRERAEAWRGSWTRRSPPCSARSRSFISGRRPSGRCRCRPTHCPMWRTSLQALMEQMERRNQQLNEQLLNRQEQFHRDVTVAYTGLATVVEQSLNDSLSASARVAGESLKPVVESAMTAIAQESRRTHERVSEAVQMQLNGLSQRFSATAGTVADTWTAALQHQARAANSWSRHWSARSAPSRAAFEQRSAALLATRPGGGVPLAIGAGPGRTGEAGTPGCNRWRPWRHATVEWESAGAMTLARQQAVIETLEQTAGAISEQASEHARQTLAQHHAAAGAVRGTAPLAHRRRGRLDPAAGRAHGPTGRRCGVPNSLRCAPRRARAARPPWSAWVSCRPRWPATWPRSAPRWKPR
jgi:hypothetical protein